MDDLINKHFRNFYPVDWDSAWKMTSIGGISGREYTGTEPSRQRIFPNMVCADGFEMSVQGHFGAYSVPRDDFSDNYSRVEIMCLADPILDAHGGHECGEEKIYGYVPIDTVERVIAAHGGLKA